MQTKKKFYGLLNDHLFKKIMHNPTYLKYLLNNAFNINTKSNITYLDKELEVNYISEKAGIVDLLIEFDNKVYIIELQNRNEYNLEDRTLYYTCKLYSSDLLKNENYKNLKVAGILVLVNHDFKKNKIFKKYMYKAEDDNEVFSKKTDIRVFNLKYAAKSVNDDDIKVKLAKFIINNNKDELDKIAGNNKVLQELTKEIIKFNLNRKEHKIMTLWDERFESEERTKERIKEVGRKEGRTSGLKQGRKEGRKEGISAGIKSVATNLLKNNAPIDLVMKSTGLSQKEINKLIINV